MREITVKEIVGLNPCSQYTEEYVKKLFNGQETVSVKYILNSPIPRLDKIWIVDKLSLISDEAINKIHGKLMDLIDSGSVYREKFERGRIWQYAPVYRFLQETKDYNKEQITDLIENLIISCIEEEVNASTNI